MFPGSRDRISFLVVDPVDACALVAVDRSGGHYDFVHVEGLRLQCEYQGIHIAVDVKTALYRPEAHERYADSASALGQPYREISVMIGVCGNKEVFLHDRHELHRSVPVVVGTGHGKFLSGNRQRRQKQNQYGCELQI